jgi:uncharacterized protein with FMN-binding domain
MKGRMRTIAIVAGVLLVIGAGIFIAADRWAKASTKDITVYTQTAVGVSDGIYTGKHEISPVMVAVRVSVENGTITDITITEHQNGLGGKAERIVDDVLGRQSLEVDAISGATVSSKTILKAIESALDGGAIL